MMAKRKLSIKRFSRHKSTDSNGFLNPDTNIMDEEKTSWWEHLEENTFTRHSMYNKTNETTKQLSFHSNLDSSQDSTAEWWKNLNLSNRGHTHKEDNVSRSSIQNFSADIVESNVLEKTSSESEKEINVKKRKLRPKSISRPSENNVFLNILNDTGSNISSKLSQSLKDTANNSHNRMSHKVSKIVHQRKEDSFSLNANILKSRPSIFKKKDRWLKKFKEDENTLQNVLTENTSSENSIEKELSVSERNSLHTTNLLNSSTSQMQNRKGIDNNAVLLINKTIHNESGNSREILKSKSRLINISAERNLERNAFEDAVVENMDWSYKNSLHKQKSFEKSQNDHSMPTDVTRNKDVSSSITSKRNSSQTQRRIDNFFKIQQSVAINKQLNDWNLPLQEFTNAKKMKINEKLESIKNREKTTLKMNIGINNKESTMKFIDNAKRTKKTKLQTNSKKIDKAFLLNGKIYKVPKLPRPKHWATDRLYTFLWKRMEAKYKLATRVQSEKFVQELAKIIAFIQRHKQYSSYKSELESLMKEMVRLNVIRTRNDFYNFCQDFLPYEFRIKVVPMLLPGNKTNVPYEPEKLHISLVDE